MTQLQEAIEALPRDRQRLCLIDAAKILSPGRSDQQERYAQLLLLVNNGDLLAAERAAIVYLAEQKFSGWKTDVLGTASFLTSEHFVPSRKLLDAVERARKALDRHTFWQYDTGDEANPVREERNGQLREWAQTRTVEPVLLTTKWSNQIPRKNECLAEVVRATGFYGYDLFRAPTTRTAGACQAR